MIGTTLSHYRVLEKLGAGGMGEVYRAEDTTLGRQVAIKVLPEALQADVERLARFEREAKTLASLNHPNIAAIHGLEEAKGRRLLVMELVEGETLAQRISRGPLPIQEALEVSRQIAEGLEAAHDKGVIHRDLKPSNVKVTAEGKVKILDFGLAKAFHEQPSGVAAEDSPTITDTMTRPGVLLGTAAYMAPEQAKGKAVDKRVDVWAFGCVLYECLTGKRVFRGESITEVLARILESEPDWSLLPKELPTSVRTVLKWCLRKDPSKRLRDLGDVRLELEEAGRPGMEPIALPVPGWRRVVPWALGGVLGVLVGMAMWWFRGSGPAETGRVVAFEIDAPEDVIMSARLVLAISPDGKHIAFAGHRKGGVKQLFLRSLDRLEVTAVPGTDGVQTAFFSPDSQWLGYATATRLWKVALGGHQPVPLCDVSGIDSAVWADDDTIIFASTQYFTLARVQASGGVPLPVTRREGPREWRHMELDVLPGSKVIFYGTHHGSGYGNVILQSLQNNQRKTLLEGAAFPRYATSGHLVWESGDATMARPFDRNTLDFTDDPPVSIAGVSRPLFSRQGTMVSVPSPQQAEPEEVLVWVDREGKETPVIDARRQYLGPRVSPDGNRLAFWVAGTDPHVWILDLRRGNMDQFTTTGRNWWCSWSPDGSRIAFISLRSEKGAEAANLYCRTIDGSSPEEQLTEGPFLDQPTAWTRDGKSVIFQRSVDAQTGWDVMLASLGSNRVVQPVLNSPANESRGELSPDNRWLAYVSTEAGAPGVFVRPFQGADRKWRISPAGVCAGDPLWSPDGKELFYRDWDAENVMAVKVDTENGFAASTPTILFEDRYALSPPYGRNYDMAPDGQRFVMLKETKPSPRKVAVVLNWFEELKRLSAARK